MKQNYYISDIKEFVNSTRAIVFNSFGSFHDDQTAVDILLSTVKPEEEEELDRILSYDESMTIVKQYIVPQKNKKTKAIRYLVDENIYMSILESLNNRMVSNMLNKMVNDGIVESAFDSNLNDFVFWIKDEEKNN